MKFEEKDFEVQKALVKLLKESLYVFPFPKGFVSILLRSFLFVEVGGTFLNVGVWFQGRPRDSGSGGKDCGCVPRSGRDCAAAPAGRQDHEPDPGGEDVCLLGHGAAGRGLQARDSALHAEDDGRRRRPVMAPRARD